MTAQQPRVESTHCPIVLVCGFLGPSNAHWCEAYWGEATKLSTSESPVLIPPISSVASAFDRACELFAAIKGFVVDYGEEHAAEHQHARFGKDYKGKGCYPEWSAEKPVHLLGHSFGGNTIRVLAYLLEVDFWKIGTSIHWVRSIVTLSSPLQGTLLTYTLGACEDHTAKRPVEKFSVGYLLGLAMHFYELVGKSLSLHDYLDFGLEYWNLSEGGWSLFYSSLFGGTNGGGTPSVCNRDNAANDLTIYAASRWNEKIRSVVRMDKTYEINIVARKSFAKYSLRESLRSRVSSVRSSREKNPQETEIQEPGVHRKLGWASLLFVKDTLTYYGVKLSHSAPLETLKSIASKELKHALSVEDRKSSWSDGLCSAVSQVSGNPQQGTEDGRPQTVSRRIDGFAVPRCGGNHYMYLHDHDHFSVVPLPECPKRQYSFFERLFTMLRRLPSIEA